MTDQVPFRRFRLQAEGPDGDGGTEYQLAGTFDSVRDAVDEISRLFWAGGQLAGRAKWVILDDETNQEYDATGEPIVASAAA